MICNVRKELRSDILGTSCRKSTPSSSSAVTLRDEFVANVTFFKRTHWPSAKFSIQPFHTHYTTSTTPTTHPYPHTSSHRAQFATFPCNQPVRAERRVRVRIFKRGGKLQNVAQLPSNNWHHKKHAGPKGVSKDNLFFVWMLDKGCSYIGFNCCNHVEQSHFIGPLPPLAHCPWG